MRDRFLPWLFEPVNGSTLGLFRLFFGAFMAYQIFYYWQLDYTFQFMAGPELLFSYAGLSFLQPLSLPVLNAMQAALLIAALLIMVGFLSNWAAAVFTLGFTYFSFIDKTLYNNHLYLFALLAFLLIFLAVDRRYSITARRRKGPAKTIPQWHIRILQFIVVVVYFYGGIAKLNGDWLSGALPGIMLQTRLGDHSALPFLTAIVAYGGVIYDLAIGFILLYRPTRKWGILLVLFFNLFNGFFLFNDIGIFPLFMIASTVLFLDPDAVDRWLGQFFPEKRKTKTRKKKRKPTTANTVAAEPSWQWKHYLIAGSLGLFVLFHLIFPLRHYWMTYNPEWTGIAADFSWRMKMQSRQVDSFEMFIQDGPEATAQPVDYASFVSHNQRVHMVEDPYCIRQLAQHLYQQGLDRGMADPIVTARIMVSMNGRPSQLMLNPQVNLAKAPTDPAQSHLWIERLVSKK